MRTGPTGVCESKQRQTDMTKPIRRPTWDEFTAIRRDNTFSAAIAVLEIDTHRQVQHDAARWLFFSDTWHRGDDGAVRHLPMLDWQGWAADVDERGRGWSTTTHRLFEVAAALGANRPMRITDTFSSMGSWEPEVWRVLVNWGTGGNNRERPGRSATTVITPLPFC